MPRNLGGIERPKDDRDVLLGAVQAPVSIPVSYLPDIGWLVRNYQGETPYCGAHASSHFKAILDASTANPAPRYTPRFSWIKIKEIDGYPLESGTDMRSIFKSQQTDGMDDFEPLENDVTLPIETYSAPTALMADMTANAKPKVIQSYAFGATDFRSLCQHIYQNKAVLLLIKCDNGFWGTATPTFTTPMYGHFVTAFGYDENSIHIIDSADPQIGIKEINEQYITPTFIIESGTALDIPVAALIEQSQAVAQQIIASSIPLQAKVSLFQQLLNFLQSLSAKVGSASAPTTMTFLTGKKTYIIGTLTIVYGIIGFATGHLDSNSAIGFLFAGLGMMGLRNGVTTEAQNLAALLPDKTLPSDQ